MRRGESTAVTRIFPLAKRIANPALSLSDIAIRPHCKLRYLGQHGLHVLVIHHLLIICSLFIIGS
jgi:hypothetical protein